MTSTLPPTTISAYQASRTPSLQPSLNDFPDEILLLILRQLRLTTRSYLKSISRASRRLRALAAPLLYDSICVGWTTENVEIAFAWELKFFAPLVWMQMFLQFPERASYVKALYCGSCSRSVYPEMGHVPQRLRDAIQKPPHGLDAADTMARVLMRAGTLIRQGDHAGEHSFYGEEQISLLLCLLPNLERWTINIESIKFRYDKQGFEDVIGDAITYTENTPSPLASLRALTLSTGTLDEIVYLRHVVKFFRIPSVTTVTAWNVVFDSEYEVDIDFEPPLHSSLQRLSFHDARFTGVNPFSRTLACANKLRELQYEQGCPTEEDLASINFADLGTALRTHVAKTLEILYLDDGAQFFGQDGSPGRFAFGSEAEIGSLASLSVLRELAIWQDILLREPEHELYERLPPSLEKLILFVVEMESDSLIQKLGNLVDRIEAFPKLKDLGLAGSRLADLDIFQEEFEEWPDLVARFGDFGVRLRVLKRPVRRELVASEGSLDTFRADEFRCFPR